MARDRRRVALAVLMIVVLGMLSVRAFVGLSTGPAPSPPPTAASAANAGHLQGLATNLIDTRPIRLVSQSDFVYAYAGNRVYVTQVGLSPNPYYATITTSSTYPTLFSLGDWNRDGRDDLFDFTTPTLSVTLSAATSSNPGTPGGKYTLGSWSTHYYQTVDIASGDWNGDGYVDAFAAVQTTSSGAYQVFVIKGTGGAPDGVVRYALSSTTVGSDQILAIASGDFNADGRDDLAVAVSNGGAYYLKIALSQSSPGSFTEGLYGRFYATLPGLPVGLTMGDWDRDGISDAIVLVQMSSTDYRYYIVFGQRSTPSTATSLTPNQFLTASTKPNRIAAGDWNADGKDDLFTLSQVSVSDWQVQITYSGSSGPGKSETAGTVTNTLYYVYMVYSFGVGDWNADSIFGRFDGTSTGSRDVGVPVALLVPPPFRSGSSDVSSGTMFYGSGTTISSTYTTSTDMYAGLGFSLGVKEEACLLACFAGFEAKVEVTVSAHIGTQVGTESSKTLTLTFQASGNAWYNPSAGKYEPLVLIVHQPYADYQIDLVQLIGGSAIPANINGLSKLAVNIPVSSGSWYEAKFLSNYNAAKARDLPTLYVSRLPGAISSYQPDDAYTSAPSSWTGPLALAQYTGQQETVVTVTEGTTIGWQGSINVDAHGEIGGNLAGISVGFVATAGLSRGYLWTYTQTTTFSIGGMPPRLSVFVTDDSYPGEQYEIYAYWSRASLTRYTFGSSPMSAGFTIWVLDWKVPYLNEGYPATISSTQAGTTSVSLGWITAGGVNPSGVHRRTGYYVQWSTSSTFSTIYSSPLLSADATSYSVTGLTSSTTYYFRVQAVFNSPSGYTNLSDVVSVTTTSSGGGGGGHCPPICPT